MKYKLSDKSITYEGITLYRIEALKDFSDTKRIVIIKKLVNEEQVLISAISFNAMLKRYVVIK